VSVRRAAGDFISLHWLLKALLVLLLISPSFAWLSQIVHIAYCFFLMNLNIYYAAFKVACVMIIWSRLQPAYAAHMWNEAMNKRFGAKICCNLYICVYHYDTKHFWILTIKLNRYLQLSNINHKMLVTWSTA
jgi:hypothetical protein